VLFTGAIDIVNTLAAVLAAGIMKCALATCIKPAPGYH
jgi:hypothetical protein